MIEANQDLLQTGVTLLVTALGWYVKSNAEEIKKLKERDLINTQAIADMRILIAGNYVKREEFERFVEAIFKKLDKIDEKLGGKADKHT